MTDGANLSCFKCHSELDTVGSKRTNLLYECRGCGMELREDLTRELADMDGAISRMAEVLLKRANGGESQ
jgi:uncharacterized Zn finger protein